MEALDSLDGNYCAPSNPLEDESTILLQECKRLRSFLTQSLRTFGSISPPPQNPTNKGSGDWGNSRHGACRRPGDNDWIRTRWICGQCQRGRNDRMGAERAIEGWWWGQALLLFDRRNAEAFVWPLVFKCSLQKILRMIFPITEQWGLQSLPFIVNCVS